MNRHADRSHDADQRMLELDDHLARDDVPIRQCLVRKIDRASGNAFGDQGFDPLLGVALTQDPPRAKE